MCNWIEQCWLGECELLRVCLIGLVCGFLNVAIAGNLGLPRYPDLGNNHIVFTAGGDLWKVPVAGGEAQRLTTDKGQERFARISPDGQWIAYTAEYEGESDVWLIPFEGGPATRLTWHSGGWMDDIVWDWTADSKRILFSSRYQSPSQRYAQYYTVSIEGGLPSPLPTSDAGPAAYLLMAISFSIGIFETFGIGNATPAGCSKTFGITLSKPAQVVS